MLAVLPSLSKQVFLHVYLAFNHYGYMELLYTAAEQDVNGVNGSKMLQLLSTCLLVNSSASNGLWRKLFLQFFMDFFGGFVLHDHYQV